MNKAILMAAVLMLAPLPAASQESSASNDRDSSSTADPSSTAGESSRDDALRRLSNSELRDRLAATIETVEEACADDLANFCDSVTPGGGRVTLCVRAYEDQMSRRCRSALQHGAANLERAVTDIAQTCLSGIQAQCGDAQKTAECVQQKSAALAPSCQPVLAALRQTARASAGLTGQPVYTSDDKNLGQVVQVMRGPDGKVQAIQVQAGRFLGIGDKVITIDGDKFDRLPDRIKLRLSSEEVRSLPAAKNPPS
jgi:PRC-barrel domain